MNGARVPLDDHMCPGMWRTFRGSAVSHPVLLSPTAMLRTGLQLRGCALGEIVIDLLSTDCSQ